MGAQIRHGALAAGAGPSAGGSVEAQAAGEADVAMGLAGRALEKGRLLGAHGNGIRSGMTAKLYSEKRWIAKRREVRLPHRRRIERMKKGEGEHIMREIRFSGDVKKAIESDDENEIERLWRSGSLGKSTVLAKAGSGRDPAATSLVGRAIELGSEKCAAKLVALGSFFGEREEKSAEKAGMGSALREMESAKERARSSILKAESAWQGLDPEGIGRKALEMMRRSKNGKESLALAKRMFGDGGALPERASSGEPSVSLFAHSDELGEELERAEAKGLAIVGEKGWKSFALGALVSSAPRSGKAFRLALGKIGHRVDDAWARAALDMLSDRAGKTGRSRRREGELCGEKADLLYRLREPWRESDFRKAVASEMSEGQAGYWASAGPIGGMSRVTIQALKRKFQEGRWDVAWRKKIEESFGKRAGEEAAAWRSALGKDFRSSAARRLAIGSATLFEGALEAWLHWDRVAAEAARRKSPLGSQDLERICGKDLADRATLACGLRASKTGFWFRGVSEEDIGSALEVRCEELKLPVWTIAMLEGQHFYAAAVDGQRALISRAQQSGGGGRFASVDLPKGISLSEAIGRAQENGLSPEDAEWARKALGLALIAGLKALEPKAAKGAGEEGLPSTALSFEGILDFRMAWSLERRDWAGSVCEIAARESLGDEPWTSRLPAFSRLLESPHWRRAHWQGYWVGKAGSQNLEKRFLAPILVRGKLEEREALEKIKGRSVDLG